MQVSVKFAAPSMASSEWQMIIPPLDQSSFEFTSSGFRFDFLGSTRKTTIPNKADASTSISRKENHSDTLRFKLEITKAMGSRVCFASRVHKLCWLSTNLSPHLISQFSIRTKMTGEIVEHVAQ